MSEDFQKVLVKDDRLMVSDQIAYAVNKGGQNVTTSYFNAVSASPTSHVYNIQVPSEQTIIDRRVMWESTIVLKLNITTPNNGYPVIYGYRDALAPFPLHQLVNVMTATINNNSVSINMKDVIAAMLRFNDKRELQRYNGTTPVEPDIYYNYRDALNMNNNPLSGWGGSSDNDLAHRGSWVLLGLSTDPTFATPFNVVQNVSGATVTQDIYVKFKVTEPLLLSPFIFACPQTNNQGFYGIQNMNFQMNISGAERVWRSVRPLLSVPTDPTINSIVVSSFSDARLVFQFLTPHPSDLLPARNVVGFYELPRYISNNFDALPNNGEKQFKSQTLQLNQVPDKIIAFVRKPIGNQNWYDADAFLPISSVSLNWNNASGLLSNATQQDLYRFSVENGSNQSWFEFSGQANNYVAGPNIVGTPVATSGSLLIIDLIKDAGITEDFYSNGSLGNFNLQLSLNVKNYTGQDFAQGALEMVIVTMNSGLFVCEKGTCSTYTGILTKQAVLDASTQEPMARNDLKRLVGGGFLDSLKTMAGKTLKFLPTVAKHVLANVGHPVASLGSKVLGSMGYGMSAGGMSAGGMSGGKKGKKSDPRLI
jgi:hypothetical protein